MKKIAILYSEYSPVIDAIKAELSECDVNVYSENNIPENLQEYNFVVLCNYHGKYSGNALAVHHSLLPAFDKKEPAKEAMLMGVKITGITIYYTKSKKIIAQYPLFIRNDMHYDELEQELKYLEQTLFPIVIKKVINNEPFEIQKLLGSSHCGGCQGCSKNH